MLINETFGECLKKLMEILNLKGSILAKGINVDPSLIYKWLRDERVPSYSSSHIDSIADFFMKCIINSFQQVKIINALRECGFKISEDNPINILDAIRKCLHEAQGYSIEISAGNTAIVEGESESKVKDMTKFFNIPPGKISNTSSKISFDGNHAAELPEVNLFYDPARDFDNIKIIRGNNEVLNSALALLQSAPGKPDSNDDTVLIALNSSINQFHDCREYSARWKHTLLAVLKKGWTIILLVRLNNDRKTVISIIESLQTALSVGKFRIYYYKNSNGFIINALLVVPKKGALYCFSSKLINQLDSAFLFRSKQSISLISEHYCQFFSSAMPLLHEYPPYAMTEFQFKLAESEESLGNRYNFNGGISTITIPVKLYEKYLKMSRKPKQETLLWLTYHRRRLEAFKTQIKYYKYKDICFKESIENLINEKKYSFNNHILENYIPEDEDIICHLENIVSMLEAYENYEVALVNKNDYKDISEICWMVKENTSLFIETANFHTQKNNKRGYCKSGISASVTEKEVIFAFQEYFISIWNEIGDRNRQKKELIKWLKSQIALLKRSD
ncbi:MAG: helix-turn-helix transcriptional regulator [Clostridiaceae bacterium]|nr:helix-turn-helix transcriptional regulator [Clostridiaceae bacterium]